MIVHGMQQVMFLFDVNHWVLPMRMMVTQQILHAVFVVAAPEGSNHHHHQLHHQYQHNHHLHHSSHLCHSSQHHHIYHHSSQHHHISQQQCCTKCREGVHWWRSMMQQMGMSGMTGPIG